MKPDNSWRLIYTAPKALGLLFFSLFGIYVLPGRAIETVKEFFSMGENYGLIDVFIKYILLPFGFFLTLLLLVVCIGYIAIAFWGSLWPGYMQGVITKIDDGGDRQEVADMYQKPWFQILSQFSRAKRIDPMHFLTVQNQRWGIDDARILPFISRGMIAPGKEVLIEYTPLPWGRVGGMKKLYVKKV